MSRAAPRLTFYCELPGEPLERLVERPGVIETLAQMGAGVRLGLLDLSPARARVVRRLHDAGVRVGAWLLLPYEEGYFQHADNAGATEARFDAWMRWSEREGLTWDAVGLDVEPDRRELERFEREPWLALWLGATRVLDRARLARGIGAHRALVSRMRSAGVHVECYQLPLIADDRGAGTGILQRALGMMDLEVDREVWMLYSSILPLGAAWLATYGPEARAIAVGSTGGGIDPFPKLDWDALRRDLLLARSFTDDVFVFSLEGCVAQQMLPRIAALDWAAEIPAPDTHARTMRSLRTLLGHALCVSSGLGRLISPRARER